MTEEDRAEMLADIADFTLMDDTFFHTCLKDCPSGMEWILRIILDDPELTVLEMHTQEDAPNLYGREVIFDVFVRDAQGKEYDVEVQRNDKGAAPRRARYNASLMDTMNVAKGTEWKDLPPAIVIFITEHDILKGGEPIYHVERTVRELKGKRFEDDAEIIYVNGTIRDDTPLGRLMQDFACKDPKEMHAEVLAERMNYFKSNEHGVMTMCGIMEKIHEKGRAEGKAEGRAEGIAEKTVRTIRNQLKRHVAYADIASDNETTVDEVIRIAKENGLAY